MLYVIMAFAFGFWCGLVTMALFAMSGSQSQELAYDERVKTLAEENDDQHAIIQRLEARLDGRELTAQEKAA